MHAGGVRRAGAALMHAGRVWRSGCDQMHAGGVRRSGCDQMHAEGVRRSGMRWARSGRVREARSQRCAVGGSRSGARSPEAKGGSRGRPRRRGGRATSGRYGKGARSRAPRPVLACACPAACGERRTHTPAADPDQKARARRDGPRAEGTHQGWPAGPRLPLRHAGRRTAPRVSPTRLRTRLPAGAGAPRPTERNLAPSEDGDEQSARAPNRRAGRHPTSEQAERAPRALLQETHAAHNRAPQAYPVRASMRQTQPSLSPCRGSCGLPHTQVRHGLEGSARDCHLITLKT